ncbi:MAG: SAM-dependent methyltransferase [Bacteroidota bacterium]
MDAQKENKLYLFPVLLAPETQDRVLSPYHQDLLKRQKIFFVENLRSARRFISSLKLGLVIDELQFFVLDKKTKLADIQEGLDLLKAGASAGVLSEAGCPGIADPGGLLVAWAHRQGIEVEPLVGPSSILLALMASGFNGQSFAFHGYLPIKEPQRTQALKELEQTSARSKQTQIFMETPYRNDQLMEKILKACRGETSLCLAVNLTAPEEWIQTKKIKDWRKKKPSLHKKPAIFLLYGST